MINDKITKIEMFLAKTDNWFHSEEQIKDFNGVLDLYKLKSEDKKCKITSEVNEHQNKKSTFSCEDIYDVEIDAFTREFYDGYHHSILIRIHLKDDHHKNFVGKINFEYIQSFKKNFFEEIEHDLSKLKIVRKEEIEKQFNQEMK